MSERFGENPFAPKKGVKDIKERVRKAVAKHADQRTLNYLENNSFSGPNIPAVAEFERAGKHLSNFCRRVSSQEHRPVLALNNPRSGAFMQLGFTHWLANFKTEDQADAFLQELETNQAYAELQQELHSGIEELKKEMVHGDTDPNIDQRLRERATSTDPTADLRLETLGLGRNRFNLQTHKFDPPTEPNRLAIHSTLLKTYKTKDKLRAFIFRQAKQWIDAGKIDSFVYPINHWKISGGALDPEEFNVYGEAKLSETIMDTDALVVAADVHAGYRSGKNMGGEISNNLHNEAWNGDHEAFRGYRPGPFTKYLQKASQLRGALEYPLGSGRSGKLKIHSVQKDLLHQIQGNNIKILDVQVLFPSQSQRGQYSPQETLTEHNAEPGSVMNDDYDNAILRKATEDLRRNPEWIKKFKDRIMLEPNYTFAGPEM